MNDRWFIAGMRLVPKKTLSRTVRRLASVRSRMAVRRFAARYGVAVEEAERSLDEYESVLDLFTRRLKPGLRPIDPDPDVLVSPVDGTVLVGGPVGRGDLFQAKGRSYSLSALLADDGAPAVFERGHYVTAYLAPRDYHRIHAPAAGVVTGYTHVPGTLYPVNAAAVARVDDLFARNERLITHLKTDRFGRVDVVKVGATNVGHITVSYDRSLATNLGRSETTRRGYAHGIALEKGAELGVFEMGSTVIVVTEAPLELGDLAPKDRLRVGQALARAL